MSITNFINSETGTIVQGVNGIRLCEESWMAGRLKKNEGCEPVAQGGEQGIEQSEKSETSRIV